MESFVNQCSLFKLYLNGGTANLLRSALLFTFVFLTSCASMQGTTEQDSQSDNAEQSQPSESAVQQDTGETSSSSVNAATSNEASTSPENEINRVGRVIQLGEFVEERPQTEIPENNSVELNYEQADLRLVFEELGDALQINMIIDPTIDNKVSLRTSPDNPLAYEDIWPLMRLLAANAGITIEQAGNVYEFRANASNIPVEIVMPGWLDDATSSEVLQVTPLTYISVESALAILNPILQPEGSIIRLGQGNLIGISGTPDQLMRVNAFLDVIDGPGAK